MKQFPKLALAAALMAGAGGLALSTPAAAKKDDKAAASQPKFTPAFVKAAQPAQTALKAGDLATAGPAITAAEAAASSDDDKYAIGIMRVQYEAARLKATPAGQKADESVLNAPLDALIANPRTPAAQKAEFTYQRGAIAFNAGKMADAVKYLTQAKQLGYNSPELDRALVSAKVNSGDVAGGTADLEAQIKAQEATGKPADEQLYRYALGQSVKSGLKPQSIEWLKRWVAAYPTAKNWHDAMYIYGLQQGSLATLDKNQIVDLYRLMRQTHSLDQYGYEEYAQKVLDSGLPDEAKTVITEGRASGKVPVNASTTAVLTQATRQAQAEGSLAGLETKARASASGQLAAQTGDAYLGQGNYAKAAALYQLALQKGGVDANLVNTHLGIALAMSGDKAGAKTAFAAVTGGPRSDIAQFWTVWLDHPVTA